MPNLAIEDKEKEAAGKRAADLIKEGMIVGIGTGSTAAFFIKYLGKRCREGLNIQAIATSLQSQHLAKKAGITLISENEVRTLDITVDGADEIDPKKQMVKGGGGALLREKIIASLSKKMIIIVSEKKCVKFLGKFPVPVEITPFCHEALIATLDKKKLHPRLRITSKKKPFITDNSNYIVDLHLKAPIKNCAKLNEELHLIPGVIETGLFIDLAGPVIIGHSDGTTTII